ncbi:MAG: GAF domain-containing protein [Anaerolineae bacterium]|nr:GAF domain-containing protein [Anaerolineae bacterium]
MIRRRGIQTQIVLIIVVALLLLTALLQAVHTVRERDSLVKSARQQSLAVAASIQSAGEAFDYLMSAMFTLLSTETSYDPDRFAPIVNQQLDAGVASFLTAQKDMDFAAVVLQDGTVYVHTESVYKDRTLGELGLEGVPYDETVRRTVPHFGTVYLTRVSLGSFGILSDEQMDLIVATAAEPIDAQLQKGILTSMFIGLAGIVLVGLAALVLMQRNVIKPLRAVRMGAQSFREGQLDYRIDPQGSMELVDLADQFNQMAEVLGRSHAEMEGLYQSVQDRTRDLEISAQIGRMAAGLRDVNVLLRETVEQIRRRFDVIYHAQVFLLDDLGDHAVLVESTGEAGQQLLDLGHRLVVGSNSVIGRVTASGETVIASDTLAGEVPWQPNPLLPDTRAEMALPLAIEGRVIGALDVQSTQTDVFTREMVQTFESLSDQLAIAIDNARLLAESDARVREIDSLNRQLTQTVWGQFIEGEAAQTLPGYVYDQMNVVSLTDDRVDRLLPRRVEAAIQVRGETIGTLAAALPGDEELNEEDRALIQAVAERVSLAVENARLFQQTQRALAETERLYETARAVSGESDLTAIYQLVTEQLSAASYVDSVEILLSGPDPTVVQYLERVYAWNDQNLPAADDDHSRVWMLPLTQVEDHTLPVNIPVAYADIGRDLPDTHPLRDRLSNLHMHSAVLAPLNAGGRWFGVLSCASRRPAAFDTGYVTFASALADQLAIAIENRRLFEEAQSEARRARALAEAGQLASQIGGEYESGLQSLFEAVAGPGHYDRWWFGLVSDEGATLRQVAVSDPALPETIDVHQDRNALAEAARIGEIVLINDPSDHPAVGDQSSGMQRLWGKHIAAPVKVAAELAGVLLIGRALDEPNLDERDIQLAATLASQVAVATENRRLFNQAESQRQNLQSIMNTMPTGVLVTDREGQVILSNQRLLDLMGPDMQPGAATDRTRPYPTVRTGTHEPYPKSEWPLTRALESGRTELVDDITILHPEGFEINLLANAAPILDAEGNITAVVGAFQNITELQELERALQNSLRETTLLYEASRSISRATSMNELVQVILQQTSTIMPTRVYIFLQELSATEAQGVDLAGSYPPDTPLECSIPVLAPVLDDQPVMLHAIDAAGELVDFLHKVRLATLAGFPLGVRGQRSGWLVLGFNAPHEFTAEERRFVTTLADQASISIENQRLLIRTEAALQDTATLYHASRAIAGAQGPRDVLQVFLDFAAPSPVRQATLYVLLGTGLEEGYQTVIAAADWGQVGKDNLAGQRWRSDEFPFWGQLTSFDVRCCNDVGQDTSLDETAQTALEAMGNRAAAMIPLTMAGRPLGLIVLGLPTPWTHTEDQVRIYESLADQAAVALENDRLFRQAQRRARQLATAAEISGAVTSILQLDQLFPQVVNLIRDSFEYDHVQIFMLSDDGTLANLAASTGEAGQKLLEIGHNLPVGSQSVIGQVTANGQPQIVLDTTAPETMHWVNPYLPATRSEMALPLIARGQILGALDVQSDQPGTFTEEDTRMLASLADLVATAIDNARLFEVSEHRAEEMSFLYNVTTAATTSPDLDEALQQAVHTLRDTLGVEMVEIFLPDESGEFLLMSAEASPSGMETDLSATSIDRSLVGWVARHNEAVVIGDLSQDPRRLPGSESARSVVAVPMQTTGDLVGVLIVASEALNAFDDNDLRLLQTLSGSLGAVIQNSRLLREVQIANEQLLEVDRLKTNFLAAMSHELRTPLNSIIGFSRVILKGIDGPLTETQEQDLTTIFESGKHLLGLVNDILDQAKIEAKKMELSHAYFKLPNVISGVMSTAVGLTRDRPIELHTELADNLPDAYGDEFRTRQILLNLVSNAAKFTNQGRITVSAFPVVEDEQPFIQVSVTDTGIGIAQEDMPLLFEAFQQVDNSTTRAVEGTGMGLPLAKSLTELQGGRIWVQSTPGVGSTFSVTIPTVPMDEIGEAPDEAGESGDAAFQAAAEFAESTAPPANSRVVLVVEDDVEMINLYRRYLSRAGYDVIGCTHSDNAEELVIAYQPYVVLLDVNMPDRDGWDVLARLKDADDTFETPVIVCSIDADTGRGFQLGASEYLIKPFSEDQLLDAIQGVKVGNGRQRILLVDDKPESIRVFREALEASERYHILEVTTGQQALDVIRHGQQIDLVILDLRMPGIDGFEVLQALRSDEQMAHIPVLVLTAEDISADERAALEEIDIYRKDAIDEQNLLDRVKSRLGRTQENE